MLKLAVAFAAGFVLLAPTLASAAEGMKDAPVSEAREFLLGRRNNLYGIDPPRSVLIKNDEKSHSKSWSEHLPSPSDSGFQSKSWLIPTKLDSSGQPGCNGSSVEDFLKGKCNKLHGFDVRPYERGNGKLPPAWGGDEFTGGDSFIKEFGGQAWRINGPTQNVNPLFNNEFRSRFSPYTGDFDSPQPATPLFGPREQKLPHENPASN